MPFMTSNFSPSLLMGTLISPSLPPPSVCFVSNNYYRIQSILLHTVHATILKCGHGQVHNNNYDLDSHNLLANINFMGSLVSHCSVDKPYSFSLYIHVITCTYMSFWNFIWRAYDNIM